MIYCVNMKILYMLLALVMIMGFVACSTEDTTCFESLVCASTGWWTCGNASACYPNENECRRSSSCGDTSQ